MPPFLRFEEEKFYVDSSAGGGDGKGTRVAFPSVAGSPSIYLSVIVPSKDEEQRLPVMLDECLDYLEKRRRRQSSFTYEVIIVDDGSSDGTTDVGLRYTRKYTSDRVRVLTLQKNRGKGGAVRLGFWVARGRYLLFADADGATRFSDFEKLETAMNNLQNVANGKDQDDFEKIDKDEEEEDQENEGDKNYAVVVGSRAHLEEDSIAHRSFFRTVLMYGFHFLVWLFCVRTVKDTQCGFKLFTRPSVRLLFSNMHVERWAFDVELLFLAERLKIPTEEVAVNWHEVAGSKLTPWKASLQMARDLFLIWFRYFTNIWTVDTKPKIE